MWYIWVVITISVRHEVRLSVKTKENETNLNNKHLSVQISPVQHRYILPSFHRNDEEKYGRGG